MASTRNRLRTVALLVAAVAVWQCCVLFHREEHVVDSICPADLRAARSRIAQLEHEVQMYRNEKAASPIPSRKLSASPARVVTSIRGSVPEEIDVNFTLFNWQSLDRFAATSTQTQTRILLMVITSQSDHSAKQRRLIRKTWLAQARAEISPRDLVVFFFLGVVDDGPLRASVTAEMKQYGDIVAVDVGDMYGGLIQKVQASIQWVVANYRGQYIAKFDDDCYVSPKALIRELAEVPQNRLYWGKMLSGGLVQRTGNRNSEPHLPRGVDWFPPFASGGGGYVLSWDLAHAVAFPPVRMLDMVNEDAHLGIFLLPFDVARVTSHKLHPYGIQRNHGGCTPAAEVVAIHYVKDKGDHDCMAQIHENVSAGKEVCESRYCGPINCDFKFPWPRKAHTRRCKPFSDSEASSWTAIDLRRSCELNGENVTRFFVAKRMRDLSCCKRLCESLCDCAAVDYYANTAWCNLYTKPCSTPHKGTEGASSYRLLRNRDPV
eukprot:m.7035 g.7035  ORF g.7035 m.7035 type:complete len:490 (+) comp3907_c0_seq1:139-1608(+)